MLSITDLHVHYGVIHAIKGVSFEVEKGEIITLIGANGAGKTSVMHAISGIIKKSSGKVMLRGKDISSLAPNKIVAAGMVQIPEGRRIFLQMTVQENLEMGAYLQKDKKVLASELEQVYVRFPILKDRRTQIAGTLSGGEQQMLAIGRALLSDPSILLLDEPSMGLAPRLVEQVFEIIQSLNESGTTILLVEQNATMALSIANRAYVLETGKIILEGNAKELIDNPMVREAYLG